MRPEQTDGVAAPSRDEMAGLESLESRRLFTAVSWGGSVGDGLWSTPGNWSAGVVPGPTDDVIIDQASNPTIRFTGASGSTKVNSLLVRNTLNVEGGTLTIATTLKLQSAAKLFFNGGTATGGAWDVTGGTLQVQNGTLQDAAITGLVSVTNTISLIGNVRFTSMKISSNAPAAITFPGVFILRDPVSIESGSATTMNVTSFLTVASTGSITIPAIGGVGLTILGNQLVNQGTIAVGLSGRTLSIQTTRFFNDGIARVDAGTLQIASALFSNGATGSLVGAGGALNILSQDWADAGTISLGAAALQLGGGFATGNFNFAGFTRTGGSVTLAGVVDNAGSVFSLPAGAGSWVFTGTISGGTLNPGAPGTLIYQNGTLTNVAVNGDLVLSLANDDVTIRGTTTFAALRLKGAGTIAEFRDPAYTLLAPIIAEGSGSTARQIIGAAALTIAPGGSITLAAGCAAGLTISTNILVNQGTLTCSAVGQLLWMKPAHWSTTGAVNVAAGTMRLDGELDIQPSNMAGWSTTGGSVEIAGLIENANTTLTLNASTGNWSLAGGTIHGGTILFAGGGGIKYTSTGGTLASVAIAGVVDVAADNAGVTILGTTSFSLLRLRGANTSVFFAGDYLLQSAVIVESSTGGTIALNTGVLTIAPTGSISVQGSGTGQVNIDGLTLINNGSITQGLAARSLAFRNSILINNGVIAAPGGTILMLGSSFQNTASGALSVTASGDLELTSAAWGNAGTIAANNATLILGGAFSTGALNLAGFNTSAGTVRLAGSLNNTGSVLSFGSSTGSWVISGGTISGGWVQFASATKFVFAGAATFASVAIDADLFVDADNATVIVSGTTSFNSIHLRGKGATFYNAGDYTLAAPIIADGSADTDRVIQGVGTLTIGSLGSISTAAGAGAGLKINGNVLVNQGTIQASAAGRVLEIAASSWSSSGSIRASLGTLRLGGTFLTGTINANSIQALGGAIEVSGALNNTGQTLTLNASTGQWTFRGGTITGGTLAFADGVVMGFTSGGGTLDGVAILGTIDLATPQATITVRGTTTFTAARLRADGATLKTTGFYSLIAPVTSEGAATGTRYVNITGQLTILNGASITNVAGAGADLEIGGTGFLVNKGVIASNATDRKLVLNAGGGGMQNNASVVMNGGIVSLAGVLATQSLGLSGFVHAAGSLQLTGTLDNTGSVLALTSGTGPLTLAGGIILGGSVTFNAGNGLMFSAAGGLLRDVAFAGEVDVTGTSSRVNVTGTTSFGSLVLFAGVSVHFPESYTLTSPVIGMGGALVQADAGTLTIAPAGSISLGSGATGDLSIRGTVLNNGLISSEAPGRTLSFDAPSALTNNATIRVIGGRFAIALANFKNMQGGSLVGGTYRLSGGGTIDTLDAPFTTLAATVAFDGPGTWTGLKKISALTSVGTLALENGTDLTLGPAAGILTSAGVVSLSPGSALTITGAYAQLAAGTLKVFVAGPDALTQYGSLHITGSASLGGKFVAVAANGYLPARGDVQDVLVAGSSSGNFQTKTLFTPADTTLKTVFLSTPGVFSLRTTSIIDLDNDGQVDLNDFFSFFNSFDKSNLAVDLNRDGVVSLADYFLFFNLWDVG